jgi:hypothetical protein
MDHAQLFRRAWHTLWRYRALWIWGIVLALTAASWPVLSILDRDDDRDQEWEGLAITPRNGETFGQALRRTLGQEVDRANRELNAVLADELGLDGRVDIRALIAAGVAIGLAIWAVTRVACNVSRTALIRMVDGYGATGERCSVWRGLRLGWSRSAWRLFWINVVVGVLGLLAIVGLFALLFAPLLLWANGEAAIVLLFAFLTAGLFFLFIVVAIGIILALTALKRLAWRACALEGLGVLPSIGRGYALLVQQVKDVGLVWVFAAAVRLGWRLVSIPLVIALIGVSLLAGSLPGLLVGGLASLVASGDLPVFLGLGVGLFLFFAVLVGPLVWLSGLLEVYLSATWTYAYRDLRPIGGRATQPASAPGAPGLETLPAVR